MMVEKMSRTVANCPGQARKALIFIVERLKTFFDNTQEFSLKRERKLRYFVQTRGSSISYFDQPLLFFGSVRKSSLFIAKKLSLG